MSGDFLHVVVALVFDKDRILITKRHQHKHQGGLWEFPGGKVEAGEQAFEALVREIKEEVNLQVISARPFLEIHHHYPDKAVFLDIYHVGKFSGTALGCENQELRWVSLDELANFDFPEANQKIIDCLMLPEKVAITPPDIDGSYDVSRLDKLIALGIDTVLLRAPALVDDDYLKLAIRFRQHLDNMPQVSMRLLLNRQSCLQTGDVVLADGLHLSSTNLMTFSREQFPDYLLLSASCHNQEELRRAEALACNFVFLSPVGKTQSHPEAEALGWAVTQELLAKSSLPVLLLGGIEQAHIEKAKRVGAFGIAGIGDFGLA